MPDRRAAQIPAAVFLVSLIVPVGSSAGPLAVAQNDPAPTIAGVTVSGDRIRVDWSKSRLTLVNFWATWCQPCLTEMPRLESLYKRHGEDGFDVVGVATDDSPEAAGRVTAFLARVPVSYTIVLGGKQVSRAWGGIGLLPTTFLVDEHGTVLRRYPGAAEEAVEAVTADVEAYLAGRPLGEPFYPQEPEPEDPG